MPYKFSVSLVPRQARADGPHREAAYQLSRTLLPGCKHFTSFATFDARCCEQARKWCDVSHSRRPQGAGWVSGASPWYYQTSFNKITEHQKAAGRCKLNWSWTSQGSKDQVRICLPGLWHAEHPLLPGACAMPSMRAATQRCCQITLACLRKVSSTKSLRETAGTSGSLENVDILHIFLQIWIILLLAFKFTAEWCNCLFGLP